MERWYGPSMPLRPTWRDVLAILIATGAVLSSVALWANGRVAIGLELAEGSQAAAMMPLPGFADATLPGVFVVSVTPDGNAARNGIYPGSRVVSLTTVDGAPVESVSTLDSPGVGEVVMHSEYGDAMSIPIEAISSGRIAGIIVGDVYEDRRVRGRPARGRGVRVRNDGAPVAREHARHRHLRRGVRPAAGRHRRVSPPPRTDGRCGTALGVRRRCGRGVAAPAGPGRRSR